MKEFLMVRSDDHLNLYAADQDELDRFHKLSNSKVFVVSVEVTTGQAAAVLRKYWRLATIVAENIDGWVDKYDADFFARASMPWMVRDFTMMDGTVRTRVKSIALHRMKDEERRRFLDRAIDVWSKKLGVSVGDLIQQLAA